MGIRLNCTQLTAMVKILENLDCMRAISFPESSFPLTSGRKTRALGATISGMRHRCRLRSETGWAESPEFGYFKMVAPRALVFRPLVKGTKTLGTRLAYEQSLSFHAVSTRLHDWSISFLESSFPLTSGRKTRALGATISGMRHRCRLRSKTG